MFHESKSLSPLRKSVEQGFGYTLEDQAEDYVSIAIYTIIHEDRLSPTSREMTKHRGGGFFFSRTRKLRSTVTSMQLKDGFVMSYSLIRLWSAID